MWARPEACTSQEFTAEARFVYSRMSMDPLWPPHFPDGCPPPDATDTSGTLYRFVKTDPPTDADMASWLELGIGKGSNCKRAALSCYRSKRHLEQVRSTAPRRRFDKIAQIELASHHGKMKEDDGPDTHCSLWLYRKYLQDAPRLFVVVG